MPGTFGGLSLALLLARVGHEELPYSLAAALLEARVFPAAAVGAFAGRFSADFLFRRALSFFWLFRRRIFIESLLSCLPMRGR